MADDDDPKPPKRPRADDRDVLRSKTPPPNVALQLARDDAAPRALMQTDESRPIARSDDEAVTQINERVRTISRELRSNTDTTNVLSKRVDSMQGDLHMLTIEQQMTNRKLRDLAEDVSKTKVSSAKVEGMVSVIAEDVAATKRIAEKEQILHIETTAVVKKAEIEDTLDAKKARRALMVKVATIMAAIAGAIATAITTLANRGC